MSSKNLFPALILGSLLALPVSTVSANDDILGQFLEQTLSVQNDPIEIFAETQIHPTDTAAISSDLILSSQSALVVNNKTGQILYQKNADRIMPIASISKLMSAMVILDAHLDMDEPVTITPDEIDRLKGTGSRLAIGTTLPRRELLHLSLMSSENRATHALGRTYPGGMSAFVAAMNRKAQSLGMYSSRFFEPTGLNFQNVSTAKDLNRMVNAAAQYPQIRINSTSNYASVQTKTGRQNYKNTNALVREGLWNIELQKTGYIREAGRSMVVKANIKNQPITIVLLNSPTSATRVKDAHKIESWMRQQHS